MAVPKQLPKLIPGGLDQVSDVFGQSSSRARYMQNFELRPDGSRGNRQGYEVLHHAAGGIGMMVYTYFDEDGEQVSELIVTKDRIYRVRSDSYLRLVNATTPIVINYQILTVLATRRFQIARGNAAPGGNPLVFNQDMGSCYDISPSSLTVKDLKDAINTAAITNLTASIVGSFDGSLSFARCLETRTDIVNSQAVPYTVNIPFYSIQDINQPEIGANHLAASWADRNSESFRLPVFINFNNVLYFSTFDQGLFKYDGQTVYGASMQIGIVPSAVATATAGNPNGTYVYATTYEQKDNRGNIVEGVISAASASVSPASKKVDVTVTNIRNTSYYNHNHAKINGAQVTVFTITVDAGHTMKVGDTAYFFDSVSGGYIERLVTIVAATAVTVAGAAVTVADNAFISNNLKINIWRNKNGGTTFYLVATIPNDPLDATQVFSDNLADASLGAEYIEPLELHGQVPAGGRAMTVYQDLLLLGGLIEDQNAIAFSAAPDGAVPNPEAFPAENTFSLPTLGNDIITALHGTSDYLLVFKNNSTDLIIGSLSTGNIRRTSLSKYIGCPSQHSIKEITPERICFCSRLGVFEVAQGRLGGELSLSIRPSFLFDSVEDSRQLHFERAWAEVDLKRKQYILWVPAEEIVTGSTERTPNTYSRVFVLNYETGEWFEYSTRTARVEGGYNFQGGAAIFEDDLWWTSRRADSIGEEFHLNRRLSRGDMYDYVDHVLPISMEWVSGWEHAGEPSQPKSFQRHVVHSLAQRRLPPTSEDATRPTFNLDVYAYRNFKDFGYDDTEEIQSSDTLAFTLANRSPEFVLIPEQLESISFGYFHNTLYERVDLSGSETELAVSNQPRLGRK